jgi:hypothetical protein
MMRALRTEHAFSDLFIAHMLTRNIRIEEDLIDQLFNSSEKRLARPVACPLRAGGSAARSDPESFAGNAGGDDWHNALAGQFLHE